MKQIALTLITILTVSLMANAQQEELKSAEVNLAKKDYIATLDDVSKAKKKVQALITEQLASVLPQKFGKYEMQSNDGNYGMQSEGVSVNKTYSKPKPKAESNSETTDGEDGMDDPTIMGDDPIMMEQQERITVMITTNMMMAGEVQNAHSMSEGGMGNEGTTAMRVKGYRAIVRTSNDMEGNTEEAQAIVGGAFITVRAQGLKEKGQAEKLLNLIDFDKLKGIVGE